MSGCLEYRAVVNANWRFYVQQSIGRLSTSMASEAQHGAQAFQYAAEEDS